MKQSVMITGATGLLGQHLCHYFSKDYEVIALYRKNPSQASGVTTIQLDLTSEGEVQSLLSHRQPDFIIHTAGLTSVDACEVNPQLAHRLNVDATANIVKYLTPGKTKLIHISTDHLFAGTQSFYTESSEVTPVNHYAKTKHIAESVALKNQDALVVRTNFYGGETALKKSFSNWIYFELLHGNKINLFDDVFFTPHSVAGLAQNLKLLMKSQLKGIYNVVGSQRVSKYDFAMAFAGFFGLNQELIVRSQIKNSNLKAPRPNDMSLSIEKIKADLPEFIREDLLSGFDRLKKNHLV